MRVGEDVLDEIEVRTEWSQARVHHGFHSVQPLWLCGDRGVAGEGEGGGQSKDVHPVYKLDQQLFRSTRGVFP